MDGEIRAHPFDAPIPLDPSRARAWLGGKGAALSELTRLGLPVPDGFTLGTELYRAFREEGELPAGLDPALSQGIAVLEARLDLRLGDPDRPLLLAVRGGAPVSMPGMLTTVLHVGLTPAVRQALEAEHGRAFALDLWRRFLETWGTGVLGVPRDAFEARIRARRGHPERWTPDAVEELIGDYEALLDEETGQQPPADARAQLDLAIRGVLESWNASRAVQYREAHGIDANLGTAVVVQRMVFGNLGDDSLAGVFFTRDPSSGARRPYGEYLRHSTGEDVVGGRRTPDPMSKRQVRPGTEDRSLETLDRGKFKQLLDVGHRLEARYGDAQDLEYVFEEGELFIVQARTAQRTPEAAARIAVEMVGEGLLERRAALLRVDPSRLGPLLTPRLPDPETLAAQGIVPLVRGLAASPGAASGPISFEGAERAVLVRSASSADHVEAMRRSAAVLTASGGLTCHAAVVARALGKPCIVGARSLYVDSRGGAVVVRNPEGDRTLREGDVLTVDGTHGLVFEGVVEREPVAATPAVGTILGWADALRVGKVYAEARDPAEARLGMSFGADGVVVAEGADAAAIREAMPDEVDVLTSAPEGLELAPASAEPMPGRAIRCPPSSVPRERLRAAQAQARVLAEVKDEPG